MKEGTCPVCIKHKPLVPDYDHKTADFRGYLCSDCWSGIAVLGDDPNTYHRLVLYLVGSNGEH